MTKNKPSRLQMEILDLLARPGARVSIAPSGKDKEVAWVYYDTADGMQTKKVRAASVLALVNGGYLESCGENFIRQYYKLVGA